MLPGAGYGGIRDLISPSVPMLDKPNILILMTDEQRAARDWPPGWADANLPSLGRLRAHGIDFKSAFANACQCSPSRSSFLTSTYAPVNRATLTPATLNPALPNFATIFGAAGYEVVYNPCGSVQDRILFTYDDGLFLPEPVQGAAHIRCVREANWKFAMYFDPAGAPPGTSINSRRRSPSVQLPPW